MMDRLQIVLHMMERIWRKSGSWEYFETKHEVSNGDTIEFSYTKYISVDSGSDR